LPAEQIRHRRAAAPVGDMNDINVGHHFEKLAGHVGRRAIARRRHRDLAWIRLGVGGGSKIGKFSR